MAGTFTPLSLQKKLTFTLLAVLTAMLALTWLALSTTVAPAFEQLERSVAEINLVRAERAIENDLKTLSAISGDWAPWDDAWAYVRGENPGFERANLDLPTLRNLELDFVLFADSRGNRVWTRLLVDGAPADPAELKLLDSSHAGYARLLEHDRVDSRIDGLTRTPLGPMLVSSRPIVTSNSEGPIAGTIVMARFLDAARQKKLKDRTEVDLSWQYFDRQSPANRSLVRAVADGSGYLHRLRSSSIVESYAVLPDLLGEPLLMLRVDTPRRVSSLGSSTVNGALLFLSAAGVAIAIITWWLLRGSIVLPLERLARHITGIRQSGDLSRRLNAGRGDEIGALAAEFDLLTHELHDARQRLLEQSFKAGKADTAAEVLHNVRNAMTPITNGIDRLAKSLRFDSSLRVGQATAELADPALPSERRDKLLNYLALAFSHVKETSEKAIADLEAASGQAREVEAILNDQEKHANFRPVLEDLRLWEIVHEAEQLIPAEARCGLRLSVHPDVARYSVVADRIALRQVLTMVILNAHEAMRRSDPGQGAIEVAAHREAGGAMVRLSVRDTGCGFDEQTAERIFQRGFTSKTASSAGRGLHWCANAIAGMGGRVSAESGGPGCGAVFHVDLPAGLIASPSQET